MSSTDTDGSVLAMVRMEAARIRRLRRVTRVISILLIACVMPLLVLTRTLWRNQEGGTFPVMLIEFTLLAFALYLKRLERSATNRFEWIQNVSVLPGLAEALRCDDQEARGVAHRAIVPLLLSVKPSDTQLFDTKTRTNLRAGLRTLLSKRPKRNRTHKEEDLPIAILRAFEHVGDPESVAIAEALATFRFTRLSQAAREALPGLRQRSEELRQSQTLLRPSDHVGDESNVLVRPAAATDGASETLLRVGVGADGDADV